MDDLQSFSLSENIGSDEAVIVLTGEIDLLAQGAVSTAIAGHLGAGRKIVLDLSEVTFIDSIGLRALLSAAPVDTPTEGSRPVIIQSRHRQPRRLFQISGLSGPANTYFTFQTDSITTDSEIVHMKPTEGTSPEIPLNEDYKAGQRVDHSDGDIPGAEGGDGSDAADTLPGLPADHDSEAGSTDQHSDA